MAVVFAGTPSFAGGSAGRAAPAPAPATAPEAPGGPRVTGLPWLGVSMDKGGELGVRVEHVVRGSPAARGGVQVGDRIVRVGGARVTAPGEISRGVAARKVGEALAIGLERRGTPLSVSIVLGVRPTSDELLRMDLVGAPAPAWRDVTPLSGAPASVASLEGRVALIDFWASWCRPCRLIAPRLSALRDRYGAQGLTVVGITTDEAGEAATFAERHDMRYPIVVDGTAETSRAYGITGLPTMILVDKRGVVRDVFVGFDPRSDARLEASIRELLAEPAAPPAAGSPGAKPTGGR